MHVKIQNRWKGSTLSCSKMWDCAIRLIHPNKLEKLKDLSICQSFCTLPIYFSTSQFSVLIYQKNKASVANLYFSTQMTFGFLKVIEFTTYMYVSLYVYNCTHITLHMTRSQIFFVNIYEV